VKATLSSAPITHSAVDNRIVEIEIPRPSHQLKKDGSPPGHRGKRCSRANVLVRHGSR